MMANNDKGRRTQHDNYSDNCEMGDENSMRFSRRGKPQQQLYRPGSGPLKKTHGAEETLEYISKNVPTDNRDNRPNRTAGDRPGPGKYKNSVNSNLDNGELSDKFNSVNISDDRRRNKKPEQQLYVPKPVAKSIAERDVNTKSSGVNIKPEPTEQLKTKRYEKSPRTPNSDRTNKHKDRNNSKNNDGNNENRSKRFSNRRRPSESENFHDTFSREIRQASEPRGFPIPTDKSRDTRSVEPAGRNWVDEKLPGKPPTGRRNSTISVCSDTCREKVRLPNLPPRLRKKYLIDNGLSLDYLSMNESWDGNSITFQGNQQYTNKNYNNTIDSAQSSSVNNFQSVSQQQHAPPQQWSQTLPLPRGRGRGRMRRYDDNQMQLPQSDMPSRPTTPQHQVIHERQFESRPSSRNESYSRPQSRNEYYNRPHSRNDNYNRPSSRNDNYNRYNSDYSRPNSRIGETYDRRPLSRNERLKTPPPPPHPNPPSVNYKKRGSIEDISQKFVVDDSMTKSINIPVPTSLSKEPKTLDWSEEVELEDKALHRVNSVNSLVDPASEQNHIQIKIDKQKSRRRRRNGGGKKKNRNRSTSRNSRRDKSVDSVNRSCSVERRNVSLERRNSIDIKNSVHKEEAVKDLSKTDNFRPPGSQKDNRMHNTKVEFREKHDNKNYNKQRRDSNTERPRRDSQTERPRRDSFNERIRRDSDRDQNWRLDMRQEKRNCSENLEIKNQNQPHVQNYNQNQNYNHSHNLNQVPIVKSVQAPGLLVLPQNADFTKPPPNFVPPTPPLNYNHFNEGNFARECYSNRNFVASGTSPPQQKTLFDYTNPNKPIVVPQSVNRGPPPSTMDNQYQTYDLTTFNYITDIHGNNKPSWYDQYSESFRSSRNPQLITVIEKADVQLQWITNNGTIIQDWNTVQDIRSHLKQCLETMLVNDLKFCQSENVEHHFWKLLFYNIIEMLRNRITNDVENKEMYKSMIMSIIDEGTIYLERLLGVLEKSHDVKLDDFLGANIMLPPKGLGFKGLALVACQKIFLFLGDLARYREKVNETGNYGKPRQWYLKAQQINPKNGRPYNQLAILAIYGRRKLDAVYYYMRSLMSSNPFLSARDSLLSLFDENRKKYESSERKRREERENRIRERMKEREGDGSNTGNGLRRETWVHPEGGRRLHRTGPACITASANPDESENEDLANLGSAELNKKFVISYLHVHGKLITKIGMESFQEAALQMLTEFRFLLQHSPIPMNSNRLLQLTALNMFAIDSTQLREPSEPGLRSEVQERALVVSLQMFNLILERCIALLKESSNESEPLVPDDVQIMLPAVKVWCDWLLCHSAVWNPPPSCNDYKVGPSIDPWNRLALLVTLLEKLNLPKSLLSFTPKEGYELVRLSEDATLCGFTPLMYNTPEPIYADSEAGMEISLLVRIHKVLFFGTEFLCGVDPPVLKPQPKDDGSTEYISVVRENLTRGGIEPEIQTSDSDLLVESFSEDESETPNSDASSKTLLNGDHSTTAETRRLLRRKDELERRQKMQEHHNQRMQAILQQSSVSIQMEVRPRYLVPDTNCFIDYLEQLQSVARAAPLYTLMVPLVVLNELEGLTRGGKPPTKRGPHDPNHAAVVGAAATSALAFLRQRNSAIKCLTSKGTVLSSSAFTVEDDGDDCMSNDDRVLATALSLCKSRSEEGTPMPGEPRKIFREVVLLTTDRNLRVKALSRDVPVRELPDFMKWAGLE